MFAELCTVLHLTGSHGLWQTGTNITSTTVTRYFVEHNAVWQRAKHNGSSTLARSVASTSASCPSSSSSSSASSSPWASSPYTSSSSLHTTNSNNNHGLCDSNKLLYKRCAKSMGRPKFRPPTAPTFFNQFQWNSKIRKISRIRPYTQNLVDVGRREGGLHKEGIFHYFCVLSFFVFLLTPTGHTRRPITTVYGSKHVFRVRQGLLRVSMIKNYVCGQNSQKTWFWGPK